jgi:hypothetical protein
LYRASGIPSANGDAYAVIHVFVKDPKLPGMFGVEVNSNKYDAKITVVSALFGNSSDTEASFFVHVDPPARMI